MTNSQLREEVSRLANQNIGGRDRSDAEVFRITLARRILLLETAIEEHCAAAPKKADLSHFHSIGIVSPRVTWGGSHRIGSAKLTTLAAGGWSVF